MSNPFWNPRTSSQMERVIAATRDALRRMNLASGSARSSRGWIIALLVCALLAIGISLLSKPGKQSSKPAQASAAEKTSGTKTAAIPTKLEGKQSAKRSGKKHPAAVKNAQVKRNSKDEKTLEARKESGILLRPQVQLSPDGLADKAGEAEHESGEEVRARASWFFDQRAYPNKHIPADAFQKAIDQRDLMRQQQRAAFKPAAAAQAIISFPGDALWHLMGPQPINTPFGQNSGFPTASGRVTAIAVDPTNANIVYIGGAAGGVWKTTDGGSTWAAMTDTQASMAIGSIAIDPNSCSPAPCSTIYVGTGEENFNGDAFYGAGILKSINGGTSWTQLGASVFAGAQSSGVGGAKIGAIAVQPGNPLIVLASVFFFDGNDARGGVWRSTDGGTTWSQPTTGAQGSAGTGVVFESPSNAGTTATAWAALGDIFSPSPASNGIWKSTDSGATWTKQTSILPTVNVGRITLGYAPSTSGAAATLYAAIADSSTTSSNLLGLFKTVNGGTAWSALTSPGGASGFCAHQCFYDISIGVSPTNPSVVVLGGGAGPNNFTSLFESTNGGGAWTPATAAAGDFSFGSTTTHPHVDTHALVFSANAATLYVGNDGGIWSTNTPTPASGVSPTWTDLNAQLAITQFYPGPTAAVSDENYGFGGTQDNDVELFQNSLLWQNEFICGDGGFTAIDQTTPTTIYATCDSAAGAKVKKAVMNGQYLTFANGQKFPGFDVAETAITASGDRMQFIPPIALDESNPESLYFGTCRVWQTTNAASSLANSFGFSFPPGPPVPLTPTWTPISGDLSNANAPLTPSCPSAGGGGNITTMDVGHSNSSLILAGTSNGKVWETITGGALWNQIDHGLLPPRHITAVRTQRNDSTGNIAYVTFSGFGSCAGCGATPGHVFATTNGGASWTNLSGDLPDIPVNDLIAFHQGSPAYDALYIATDVGVFSCPNPATTLCTNWTVVGDGLPNSPVLGLAMRRSTRILRASTHGRSTWQIQLTDVSPPPLAAISSMTPAAVNVGAASTAVTINGLNFSASTQVQFAGSPTGVTTTFVNTTQLNVTLSNTLFTVGGVFPITLTDPAGVDSGSSLLTGGGAPFAVMNPLLDPLTMTPTTALTYTAVPFHLTSATATEPFLPNSVLAFYDTSNPPVLQFQLPTVPSVGTVSSGGTVYDLTTAVTQFTTPFTYQVVPYNPTPGGGIDDLAVTAAGAGGNVPFTFTVTANPNPLAIVSPNPIVLSTALGTTSSVLTVSITNPGGAALNITAQSITGTNAANFSFAAPAFGTSCNFPTSGQSGTGIITLAAGGGTCNFGMTYFANPATPGNANSVATLNLADNGTGNPQAIPITGVPLGSTVLVAVSPVNFGAVAIGATSPTMNATLINLNSVALNVNATGFTISGANASDFHFTAAAASGNPACPALASFALAANSLCDVGLNFTPSVAGTENATINVADDGPGSPQNAPLLGVGVQITSISPSIVSTGGPAFTLTVNGGGFAPSAVVNVNGNARPTTFVSANQLLASIPATDIATAGSLAISVTTPVPGGTQSEPKTLVVAQAPPATNDNINFATTVGATPFRITEDTTQATVNTGGVNDPAVSCATNSVARSVWFKFVAPATGRVIADTKFARYLTILSAWTGTPGSLVAVPGACASGNIATTSPAQTFIGFPVTNGTTYFLMATDASGTGPGGTLTFSLDFASAAPANDPFAGATNIAAAPFTNTVNSILATANTGATDPTPSCTVGALGLSGNGTANSVWYKFTAPANGTITADTLTSPYNTILTAVTGAPGSFSEVACNDNVAITVPVSTALAQSQVSFAAASGTTYFFMVSSFLGDGGTTNFHVTFSAVAGPGISFNPTNIPFGGQKVGTASATTNLTITNNGTATLNTTSITLTGANPTQFTLGAPTSGTACVLGANAIAAGNSCNVGVKFSPTASGAQSANVSVADNAPGSPQTVSLTGTGTVPVASLAPANIAFGNQTISTSSATSNVTISNTGQASMNITSITLTGTNPTQFTLVAPTSGTPCPLGASVLNAGTNCSVGVQFAPTALGAQSANVSFADDAAGSPQTVPLTGTGVSAPAPVVTLAPTSIPFGNQKVGTTSSTMSATLTNTGNANLNITGVSIAGANAADFTPSGTTCTGTTVLTPTQSCTLGATFTPSAQGARAAAFTIADNASGNPHSLPLSGTGTIPGVGLAPANIPFGNLPINTTSATTNVTLTNSGQASLNITGITLTGTDTAQFTVGAPTSGTACPLGASNLAAGSNCAVGVKFAPTTTGAKSASVSFVDDASGSPQTVPLTGTGTAPGITFAPTNIPFGSQRTGTSTATTNVTITNSGTATLNITGITLTGANPTQFTLGAPTSGTPCVLGVNAIAPGSNCSVGMKFSPTNTGAQSANVSVADDAAGSPQTVPLTGTGTASAVTFAPTNIAFGNQRTGTSSTTTNVVITNSGTATLNTTSITLTGANPTQFTLGAPTSGTPCVLGVNAITAGSNCSVGVKFSPTNTGAQSASVSVADDAPGTPQTVPLTGTGTASAVTFAPTNVPFANQVVSTQSAVTNVTITNTGTATLNITGITLTGANPGDFAVGAPASGTACPLGASALNAGISCNVGVSFSPTTTGARSANVSVADDAPASPQTVPLTGTGTAASITLSPSPVPFGNQPINTTSSVTTVTFSNTGNASATLAAANAVTIIGTNPGDFTIVAATGTNCANNLVVAATNGSCVIGVTFKPTATGARTATLQVSDNAATSPQSVTLNGTGTAPIATVAPLNIPFGNQRKGTMSAGIDVTVSNTGTGTLNIATIALTGANPSQFVLGAPSSGTACSLAAATPVAPASNCKFSMKFAPAATGAQAASVTITDDSGGTAGTVQTVTLSGTGTLPQASAAPSPLPFGNQRKGTTSAALTVTLTNTGTDTLNLAAANAVTIGGANAGDFAIVAGTTTCKNSTVVPPAPGPGNACVINVTFTPSTAAAEAATLTITDDSGGVAGTVQNVSLAGTGVLPQGGAAPPTLAFGNQPKGVTSAAMTATLTNSGTDTLNLAAANAVTITGTNATDFAVVPGTTTCKNSTAVPPAPGPGNTCVVNVIFTPSITAAEVATLTITDDSGGVAGSQQIVSLTGTGTTVTVALSPSPAAFNNQRVGTTSAALTMILTNSGNGAVTLAAANAVSLAGGNVADFAITGGTCANSLALTAAPGPGNTCTVTATFAPSALGAENTTLTVSFQGGTPPAPDNLTGTGVFPQATPSPSPVNFNNQVINTTSGTMTVTLTNGGTDVLHLAAANAVVIGGTNPGDFASAAGTTCTNGATVNPAANCIINLTFTPSALNARTATLTVADDANPASQVVTLNGTGTNPSPAITTLSPTSATAGGAPFTLTVNGTAFVNGAVVNFNGVAKTTVFVSATQVTAAILAADIATAGTANVTVTNPAPGGGTSAAATFTINNPVPTITTLLPTSATAGGAAFTLTVNGTNFVSTSVVNFNGAAKTTTFVNATQVTAAITAADIAAGGTFPVTVTNPTPGGGTSAPTNFTVNNPVPTITSLAPSSATAGGAAFTLTVNGTGFVTGQSLVKFNGNAKTTTVVSATQVTAPITAADIATAGTFPVTVTNPAPGGGTSAPTNFTVNNPVPTITTLSPSSTTAGGAAFTLTVNGTNFVAASVVNFSGAAKTTTFVSATQVTAAITAADIATAGTASVTVTNPAPGGGTSAGAIFAINNPAPILTSLSPTSANAGGAAFTLTVNGSKFVNGAVVSFNGTAKTTTFASAAQVTAAITAADIATAGTFNVIVTNPAPTVGPSAALPFTVNNPVPTVTSATAGGKTHVAGGTAFTLTVNGTLFVSTSVINFNGKAEPTTFAGATQLTAAIPASDVATAGNVNVTVTNPAPGGGTTAASTFTVDGFAVSGPANTTVKAGQQAMITITVTPTANGFNSTTPISFTVAGLPAHTTAAFAPPTVSPGTSTATTTLTITTVARGTMPPSSPWNMPGSPLLRLVPILWFAALLAGVYAMRMICRAPQLRRYAAIVPLALLLVTGAVLAGCAGGKVGTPAGASQLTITGTSGTMVQATQTNSVTLTVQ